jgi:hypothetical protein
LQVTGPPLPDVDPDDVDPEEAVLAGAAGAAAAGAALPAELVEAEADLLMPPCPLQAPRPPCGDVVPSLQTTGVEVLCANDTVGVVNTRPASATHTTPLSFVRSICSLPLKVRLIIRIVRILQTLRLGYAASRGGDAALRPGRSTLAALKLNEDDP